MVWQGCGLKYDFKFSVAVSFAHIHNRVKNNTYNRVENKLDFLFFYTQRDWSHDHENCVKPSPMTKLFAKYSWKNSINDLDRL